jgi:lysocardiolipin and lysophospholipid acyltransferase
LRRKQSASTENARRKLSVSSADAIELLEIPDVREVLCPRVKGFTACVEGLAGHATAVYDMTVAYSVDGSFLRPANNPSMEAMMDGEYTQVHVHLKRHSTADIPTDRIAIGKWLIDRFVEKDRLLQNFYQGKGFPGGVVEDTDRRGYILANSAFWLGLLGLTLSTKVGRQIYATQVLFCGLGGCIGSALYLKATNAL